MALSLFSPSESLEDISTHDIVYLFVPWVYSEVVSRVRTTEREERKETVLAVQVRVNALKASSNLLIVMFCGG